MSASAYYQRASGRRSTRAVEDERLLGRIREVHAANYCAYGSRRMWKALHRAGEPVGRDRVKRLMRSHGIQGAKRRGKPWRTTTPDPMAVRPPDRVNRDFTAAGRDRLWVADFCYLRCWEGVVFFAFVIDVWSRRVVGWQLAGTCALTWCSMRCDGARATAPAPTCSSCTTATAGRGDSSGRRNASTVRSCGGTIEVGSLGSAAIATQNRCRSSRRATEGDRANASAPARRRRVERAGGPGGRSVAGGWRPVVS